MVKQSAEKFFSAVVDFEFVIRRKVEEQKIQPTEEQSQ